MVSIVSGDSLGLSLGSLANLDQEGAGNAAPVGRNGERAYVNAATGNLVLQRQDDYLSSRGADLSVLRTYNSRGVLAGGGAVGWALGSTRQRLDNGSAGNIIRTDRDLAQAVYSWDAARALYATTAGAGADDTLVRNADGSSVWTDGDSGAREFYDASGRLVGSADAQGNAITYTYDAAGRLVMSTDPTGVRSFVLYDERGQKVGEVDGDGSLTELRYDSAGRQSRSIRYATAVNTALLVNAQGQALMPQLAAIRPAADAKDASEWRAYDAAGRLAATVDAVGAVVGYCPVHMNTMPTLALSKNFFETSTTATQSATAFRSF